MQKPQMTVSLQGSLLRTQIICAQIGITVTDLLKGEWESKAEILVFHWSIICICTQEHKLSEKLCSPAHPEYGSQPCSLQAEFQKLECSCVHFLHFILLPWIYFCHFKYQYIQQTIYLDYILPTMDVRFLQQFPHFQNK